MSFFPRFLSGLIEIDDAWLRSPFISGGLRPFGSVALGSSTNPFSSIHVGEVTNRYGQMRVNDVSSGSVIDLLINEGVLSPKLKFNDTLTIDPDGNLGVRERILTPSNLEFSFSDPLHFVLDETDHVGGDVSLYYQARKEEMRKKLDEVKKQHDQALFQQRALAVMGMSGNLLMGPLMGPVEEAIIK